MRHLRAILAHLRTDAAAYLVLAVALAATAAVYVSVAAAIDRQVYARFHERTRAATESVRNRMDAYVSTLRATRGLFAAGRRPTRAEFRLFVQNLNLDQYYPGIQGIGFAELLDPGDIPLHEATVREEGFPEYQVWPPGQRESYAPIVYLEPFDWRNQRAFGFDMMSEPVRREGVLRARATGHPACSARVELVQEDERDRQPGFLCYLPVAASIRGGAEQPIVGFIYAAFRARDLFVATLAQETLASIHLDVHDGPTPNPEQLLHATAEPPGDARLVEQEKLEVAGQPWTLRFTAGPRFVAPWEHWLPRWAAVAGALVSLLLFRVTRREARAAAEARRAALRSSFLADAGKVLSSSLDYDVTLAEVATRAARGPCDWCVIMVVERSGPIRLIGHSDPRAARGPGQALAEVTLDPEGRFAAAAALERGEPFVANDVSKAELARIARDEEHLARLRAARLRSLVTVPLRARGEALGAITFASTSSHRFDATDVRLAQDLARLVVAAIDTARLYRRAQEAIKLRDEFLSIASHELKTPLTSLALQADSLRASGARGLVPEPMAHKAEVIRRNVDRLSRLITNLLDISRMGERRLALDLEDVDLSELVCEVAARFEDELARAGSTLQLDVPGPVVGRWDRLRLDQVVTNLVANAVKYGHGKPIYVHLRTEGDRVVLAVRDEGIGIPREAQERIFERFERAVSDRHFGGFGLGLWIVRRIVEALGGRIMVESEPGHGATFTVELWREPPAARSGEETDTSSSPVQAPEH